MDLIVKMETPTSEPIIWSLPSPAGPRPWKQAGLAGDTEAWRQDWDLHLSCTLAAPHLVWAPRGTLLPPQPPSLLSQQLDLDPLNEKVDSRGAFSENQC